MFTRFPGARSAPGDSRGGGAAGPTGAEIRVVSQTTLISAPHFLKLREIPMKCKTFARSWDRKPAREARRGGSKGGHGPTKVAEKLRWMPPTRVFGPKSANPLVFPLFWEEIWEYQVYCRASLKSSGIV